MKLLFCFIATCLVAGLCSGQEKLQVTDAIANGLSDAAGKGDVELVRSILLSGVHVDTEEKNFRGWTGLMAAATNGKTDVVKFLLAHRASTSVRLEDGSTVLIQAAQNDENQEIVAALLKAGADVNAQSKSGLTALMRFAWMGHREGVKLLLDAAADTKLKNEDGWTAFYFACSHGNDVEIVRYLLKRGSDPNERLSDGTTPLMWVGWGNREKNFEALIPAGADVNARANDRKTPLMISASRLYLDEVELLLNAKADVNLRDRTGRTALMHASASNFRRDEIGAHGDGNLVWLSATRLIEKLVRAGAAVNEQDENGDTALILAYKNRNPHFAEQLLKLGADAKIKNRKGHAADYYRLKISNTN